ncbi:sigma-70 family RNA polymerase sigma factor [Flavobacterium azooxidireducens]|uniref:Sigma-70 family RNA polymerase sigma factor n=1 Tax=Flavobacterium azooxidireducens TaxID=1871076 RepID=A0ABY4KDJ4_9FLAO|nr:sigma-70 family RNA polymerase sigma factor [Flavobacterium azooxidireducens]UPQ78864.1 sigma-70 family RNA polymerase sigma factor [Flavobacterium azooxidireducens]
MEKQAQFNELFNTHYPKVLRLCKGYFNGDADLAADASQEVFIKVWENLDSFRNESGISTWIFRITVNTCLVYLRKKSTKKEIRSEQFPNLESENYSPEIEEKLSKMYACIQKLEEMGKMIILMALEGMDYSEIAQVVGLTEETLRVRIHRIKKSLTQCVQK